MGGVSEQTVERVHGALIDKYGDQPFRCDQRTLAAELGLSAPTVCMALAVLRGEGRLTRSGKGRRETWRVYGDASARRAARSQPRPGVSEQLEEIRAALAVISAQLASGSAAAVPDAAPAEAAADTPAAPQAQAPAAPAASPPPNPLLIKIFFNAADEAELAGFRVLKARGGGDSLASQTLQLYRALLETSLGVPDLTGYVRGLARPGPEAAPAGAAGQMPSQDAAAPAAPLPGQSQAPGAAVTAVPAAAASQPAGSSQAGPEAAAGTAHPDPAPAAAAQAAAAERTRVPAAGQGSGGQAAQRGQSQVQGTAASAMTAAAASQPAGSSQAASAAAAAADLAGIPRPQGQLRRLASGTAGVPADWPQEWPAGTYGCDEQGVIFYLRTAPPLPLPRQIRPDPQQPSRLRTEGGQIITPQQLLGRLQVRARSQSPQWQDCLSLMQPRQG